MQKAPVMTRLNVAIPKSQATLAISHYSDMITYMSPRSTHQALTAQRLLSRHTTLLTTRYADSTCTCSDWSHPTLLKPHPCDAEAGKPCPRASKLPETHHHHTRRNRHPTTGIPVPHIFLIDCSVSRGSLLLSCALSRLES